MPSLLPISMLVFFSCIGCVGAIFLYTKKKRNATISCPLDGDCTGVLYSSHATFFGIEVSLIGAVYYGGAALFYGMLGFVPGVANPTVLFVAFIVTFIAFLFSLYLLGVQALVLRRWCTWCILSSLVATVIFGIALSGVYGTFMHLLAYFTKPLVILHAFGAALGVGAVTMTDIFFFKFLKDFSISAEESDTLATLSEIIWFALILAIVTGIGLYLPASESLAVSSKFIVKMIILVILVANGIFLNLRIAPQLVHISFARDVAHSDNVVRRRRLGFTLGSLSLVSWYFVFVLGSLRSVTVNIGILLTIYIGIAALAIGASQLFDWWIARRARQTISSGM